MKWITLTGLFTFLVLIAIIVPRAYADTSLIVAGDWGCKSAAKSNLANIAKNGSTFLGLGDYLYNCSKSDIQKNWDAIKAEKHGVYGNHDVEKTTSKQWAKDNFGLGALGWFTWKVNGEVAIIGINNYAKFEQGSPQYGYLLQKTNQFCNREDINWIVYATHEPVQTPSVQGGHGPNKPLRNALEPLAEKCGNNVLILQAHNHVSAFGNVGGENYALCGGGGQAGDSLGDLNGFETGTGAMGYCKLDFKDDGTIKAQVIGGTDGKTVKASHVFTNQ